MTAPRVHRFDGSVAGGLVRSLCGRLPAAELARGPEAEHEVTCRDCLRLLAQGPGFAPADLSEPAWEAPPPRPVDPDRVQWPDLPERTRRLADRGTARQAPRPRWGSPEEAARHALQVHADGFPAPSASGCVERIGTTGVRIDTGGRGSSKGSRLAEGTADVALAIEAAAYWAQLPAHVSYPTAVRVWLDLRVGQPTDVEAWQGRQRGTETQPKTDDAATVAARYQLGVGEVTALALEVRRAVLLEMAVRGMAPTPRRYEARIAEERAARGWA